MTRLFIKSGILVFALLLAVAISASEVNNQKLYDFNGSPASLDHYTGKGKWLVVVFWASDCKVCNEEAGSYARFHNKNKTRNAVMLGVSMDGESKKAAAIEFIKRHGIDFPNLIGEPGDVSALYTRLTYEIWLGTPMFLIYSPAGKLVASQVGAIPVSRIEEFIKSRTGPASDNNKASTSR